jgi:poly(3-hydroxybutyrate) depolymerase
MHDLFRHLLLPAAALGLSASVLGATGQELREADHKKLGALVERFWEKRDNVKEADKIREDLREELAKAGKKKAGKDGDAVQAALSMVSDLQAIAASAVGYKNLRGGKPEVRTLSRGGATTEYTLLLPATYKPSDGPYPLVLIAPDLKEGKPMGGEQFLQEFWIEGALRDGLVLAVVHLPQDPDAWDKLFVEDGSGQRAPGGLSMLMTAYADALQTVAVDPARVYVAGRGRGVATAMALGSTFPQNFAGIIGQAGDPGKPTWQNFRNLPVLLQAGGAEATTFADAVKGAGHDNATVEPEVKNEALLAWIQDHPRESNPTAVVLHPGSPIPTKAYWLSVPPTAAEEGTYVKAEIDRSANKVTVEGKGVRSVTLYFNDVLVDMDKPIQVVLNGQAQEVVVPRSLDDYLDLLYRGTSDSARVYVASRTFDLPE